MEKYSEYSNIELRRKIESLINEYESTKNQIEKLCQKMDSIEREYLNVDRELNSRKNIS